VNPYWIQAERARIAIVPRPRGWDWLAGDVAEMKREKLDVIVSALMPDEAEELGLTQEAENCYENGMEFASFPIEDRSIPASVSQFREFIARLNSYLDEGKAVGIHCRACIGRSSVIAAAVLIARGQAADDALRMIEEARGCSVPDTREQKKWIQQLAATP